VYWEGEKRKKRGKRILSCLGRADPVHAPKAGRKKKKKKKSENDEHNPTKKEGREGEDLLFPCKRTAHDQSQ